MSASAGMMPQEAVAGDDYQRTVHQLIDNFFSGSHPRFCPVERAWNPPTDVFETTEAVHIKMEVAGVAEGDIEVKVSGPFLAIRGRREDGREAKRENFHLMEIQYGRFERIFRLPIELSEHDISASLKNGFLHVSIPKRPNVREYRIEIQ